MTDQVLKQHLIRCENRIIRLESVITALATALFKHGVLLEDSPLLRSAKRDLDHIELHLGED